MKSNIENNNQPHPTGGGTGYVVAIGSTGKEIAESFNAIKSHHGTEIGISEIDVFETAGSPAGSSATFLPEQEPVSLSEERIHVFPECDTGSLAQTAERHPNTRQYARSVLGLPPFKTSTGAAGYRLIALLVLLASLPLIRRILFSRLSALRERRRVASHLDTGASVDLGSPIDVFFTGASFGGTMSGMAPLFISETHRAADLLGLPIRVHVPHVTPSVAQTHDFELAQANHVFFRKEMIRGQIDPASWVFYELGSGNKISHSPGKSLIHELSGFGVSNGRLVTDRRTDAATLIALDIYTRIHTGAGSYLESRLCDTKKMILDTTNGVRCLRTVGIHETRIDADRSQRLAVLAAQLSIARNLNL